jgi:hypothetical protein
MDDRIKQAFEAIFPGAESDGITARECAILSILVDMQDEATRLQTDATTWRSNLPKALHRYEVTGWQNEFFCELGISS